LEFIFSRERSSMSAKKTEWSAKKSHKFEAQACFLSLYGGKTIKRREIKSA